MAGSHSQLRREPRLAQHEAQPGGFRVRGSGRFVLGDPAPGQGHSTRASWLGKAGSPLEKHLEVPPCLLQSSCGGAGWPALRLGGGCNRPPATLTPPSPDFPRVQELLSLEVAFDILSRRSCKREDILFTIVPPWPQGLTLVPRSGPREPWQPRRPSPTAMYFLPHQSWVSLRPTAPGLRRRSGEAAGPEGGLWGRGLGRPARG